MSDLLSPAEAWGRIVPRARALPAESVALAEAVGRRVAVDVSAPIDVPGFDRSAMDGWAVRAADTPGTLRVAGEVAAGAAGDVPVAAGQAVRIFTGGAIPPGADAVERQEDVRREDDTVVLERPVEPGQHIRRRGEDIAAGDVLLRAGEAVRPQAVTALAAVGLTAVAVHRRARVGVLLTGNELVAPGRPLGPGQIHETSGVTLRALLERAGAEVVDLGTAPDDAATTNNRVQTGIRRADVLLVCGGISVGDHDHVRGAMEAAGVEELFWRVRIKPGKPLFCGVREDRWAFGLPGNPLSVLVTYLVFVEPLLRRLHGDADAAERRIRVRTTRPIAAADGRTTYLTATFGADGATPTAAQGSAMTGSLARADGFLIAPDGAGAIPAGTEVDALVL